MCSYVIVQFTVLFKMCTDFLKNCDTVLILVLIYVVQHAFSCEGSSGGQRENQRFGAKSFQRLIALAEKLRTTRIYERLALVFKCNIFRSSKKCFFGIMVSQCLANIFHEKNVKKSISLKMCVMLRRYDVISRAQHHREGSVTLYFQLIKRFNLSG